MTEATRAPHEPDRDPAVRPLVLGGLHVIAPAKAKKASPQPKQEEGTDDA